MTHPTSLLVLALVVLLAACSPYSARFIHDASYVPGDVPPAPDYTLAASWAALPDRADAADVTPPETAYPEAQSTAPADVFWVHPTLYTDDPGERFAWNADVADADLNARIDESTIRMQASAFNAAGRVFAPRYRQAHISTYYTEDSLKSRAAFDTAYADVRRAFREFLRKHNGGRPIIIAGHSQGTTHAKRLVREYFDGTPRADRLVAAYLVGMPVAPDYFAQLPPCTSPAQTGCFVSWRTWQRPATPPEMTAPYPVVTNPLSWTTDTTHVPATRNAGGTLRKLELVEELTDAQVHRGILWINRPDFFGKRIIRMDNWHAADVNLFYESVRGNAVRRVEAWQSRHQ